MRPLFLGGGVGETAPLKTSTSVRLSVQIVREDERTCFLAVWACVDPLSVVRHAVLLRRDNLDGF